jgi:hypothetical protein
MDRPAAEHQQDGDCDGADGHRDRDEAPPGVPVLDCEFEQRRSSDDRRRPFEPHVHEGELLT